MAYSSKVGADQPAIDLVAFDPQPHSDGVQYAVRDDAVDGSVSEQAAFVDLVFDALTVTEYVAILTQLGLNSATTAVNTVNVPNELFIFARYNGIAVRPEKGKDIRRSYFLQDIHIIVKDLTAAA